MKTPLEFFAECPIPHIIIGGHVVRALGYARQTVDFNCMIDASSRDETHRYIETHGYMEWGRTGAFTKYRHTNPSFGELDVMLVDEPTFQKLYAGSRCVDFDGLPVRVPKPIHLIALKLHAMRNNRQRELKDGADILEVLRAHRAEISDAELEQVCLRYGPPAYYRKLKSFLNDEPAC